MTRRRASEQVRARLIQAAVEQLAEEGMRGLTHRRVEVRAGVSQGTAKYHFGSLEGLVEAVLRLMVVVEMDAVMDVPEEVVAEAMSTGTVPPAMWQAAQESMQLVFSRPDLLLARYELVLHVARHPELREILREARDEFVHRTAAALPSACPGAGARMVIAMVDGLALHQLSAPEPLVDRMAPAMLLATSAAALALPGPDQVPVGTAGPDARLTRPAPGG